MPVTKFDIEDPYEYMHGFHSYLETEAIPDTLPIGQNSPQRPAHGLYTEKFSGTAFTAPRHENLQTWLYRVLPAAAHSSFEPLVIEATDSSTSQPAPGDGNDEKMHYIPNQLRWNPFDFSADADWVSGMRRVAGAGDPTAKQGLGIHVFAVGRDMAPTEAFYSADGDLLVVPQHGALDFQTELGRLRVRPTEICVIPRGLRHRVTLPAGGGGPARGYVCELYQGHFRLPELGPIGSNGLANARDFQIPVACFDDDDDEEEEDDSPGADRMADDGEDAAESENQAEAKRAGKPAWRILCKFNHALFAAAQAHTPFDVVAWHGTHHAYKYDLGRFNTLGSVSYDHPDPSIFTVLSAPAPALGPGTAVVDLVCFPPRWLVAEATFRPPWYHRNVMAEFMGLLRGAYDARTPGAGGGFRPAGASLHNVMSAHGPDAGAHAAASAAQLAPARVGAGSMAFMFESCLMLGVTEWGLRSCEKVQETYNEESWQPLKRHFRRPPAKKEA